MAEKCSQCGRSDLMSPLVDNYQCLACGALTAMDTHSVVPDDIPNVITSPSGHPVTELSESAPVVLAPVLPPEEPAEVAEPEVEAPQEVTEAPVEANPIDLSSLSDAQIQALRDALG